MGAVGSDQAKEDFMFRGSMLFILLLSVFTFAQAPDQPLALSEGSVVALQVEPNPLNSTFVYDFELCCGYPYPPGGFLGNGFAYVNGHFNLFFKYAGQQKGFTVTGVIDTAFAPQPLNKFCVLKSFTLKNMTLENQGGMFFHGLVGEYSQQFCQRNGVFWSAGGELTVHAP